MHRLYPNRYGRATRTMHRLGVLCSAAALTIALGLAPMENAWAKTSLREPSPDLWPENSLREPNEPNYEAFGWTSLALSAISFAVGVNGLSQRDDNLNKAEASFKRYKAASDVSAAAQLRAETGKFHNAAKAWESTANVGLLLGVLFGASSYYSFTKDPNESSSMVLTHRTVGVLIRF